MKIFLVGLNSRFETANSELEDTAIETTLKHREEKVRSKCTKY